jgi:hypothetical protein
VALGAWQVWLGPERLLLVARRSARDTAVAELARLRRDADGLPGLQRDVRALEAQLGERGAIGTSTTSDSSLLEVLHGFATEADLELTSFAHAPAAPGANTKHDRLQITLAGGFHGVVAFLARLMASGRVAPSSLDVVIKPAAPPAGPHTIVATVVAAVTPSATRVAIANFVDELAANSAARDPFVPPHILRRAGASASGDRAIAAGLAGLSTADVVVTGVVRAGGVASAILQAPDRRTFVARPADQLLDATVKSVDERGVVFLLRTRSGKSPQPSELRKPLGRTQGAVR